MPESLEYVYSLPQKLLQALRAARRRVNSSMLARYGVILPSHHLLLFAGFYLSIVFLLPD